MWNFNLSKAIKEVISLPDNCFEAGKELLMEVAFKNGFSDKDLVNALEDFMLTEEYYEFLQEMEDVIEYNISEAEQLGMARVGRLSPPPPWIASGGSPSIRLWHKAVQKSMNHAGVINYHKSISTWKDLESEYHDKDRLKKVDGVPMADMVKDRFKDDKENNVSFYVFARKAYPELKAVYKDGKPADNHPNVAYLSDMGRLYMGQTNRNLFYRMISKAVDEGKAEELMPSVVGQYAGNSKDWAGVEISSDFLDQFAKRTYHASKYYKSHKASNDNLKTEHLL